MAVVTVASAAAVVAATVAAVAAMVVAMGAAVAAVVVATTTWGAEMVATVAPVAAVEVATMEAAMGAYFLVARWTCGYVLPVVKSMCRETNPALSVGILLRGANACQVRKHNIWAARKGD